ncbi:hypothetical protein MTR67_023427 [Solanum verrucosum]|uniref:Reverse transcriptase RNase H-like domain-containing protein n=1 Tax=Solanum verrucosum TaxID=315347 RepID=A0AAF0QTH9_SOLVR|nr:hypothetical protein MTR67_023427 [Solanum verrucosum]
MPTKRGNTRNQPAAPTDQLNEKFTYAEFKEDHVTHLRVVLQTLRDRQLFAKFNKYGSEGYMIYSDASRVDLGCVLMQWGKVDVFTDHKSLQYVFSKKYFNLCQRRWLEFLKEYDMNVLYHPGKAYVVADALSRLSMGSVADVEEENNELAKDVHLLAHLGFCLTDTLDGGVIVQNG